MLTSASEYFRAMFATQMRESIENKVTMNEIAGDILETVITFCYTGTIELTDENVDGIVAAASLMRLACLEELCEEYLIRTLDRSNCLELLLLATQYRYNGLIERADILVMDSFQHFINDEKFLHVKVDALVMLLKNDLIFVYSEDVIFEAIVRWIDFDEDDRRSSFQTLMSFVRFDQLNLTVQISLSKFVS